MTTTLLAYAMYVCREKESTQIVNGKINDLNILLLLSLHFGGEGKQWRVDLF